MSLERRTVTYNETEYSRLIGQKVTSAGEIAELAEIINGGNYFYGGVLDTGSELCAYFGQGPSHEIFKQMIKECSGKDGVVFTCQIGVNRRKYTIEGLIFLEDPGKKEDLISINDTDNEGIQRRKSRIMTIVSALPKDLSELEIPIGWFEGHNHMIEYVYYPQKELLENYK